MRVRLVGGPWHGREMDANDDVGDTICTLPPEEAGIGAVRDVRFVPDVLTYRRMRLAGDFDIELPDITFYGFSGLSPDELYAFAQQYLEELGDSYDGGPLR